MSPGPEKTSHRRAGSENLRVIADPGICGFKCSISAWKDGAQVKFDIKSECGQIKNLAMRLSEVEMEDLFIPFTKSPFFLSAEKSKCHLACPIPSSLVKTAEVALGLALPKDVSIRFLN